MTDVLHCSVDGKRTICGLDLAKVSVRYLTPYRAQYTTCKRCLASLRKE
jgi:hypothetical protein